MSATRRGGCSVRSRDAERSQDAEEACTVRNVFVSLRPDGIRSRRGRLLIRPGLPDGSPPLNHAAPLPAIYSGSQSDHGGYLTPYQGTGSNL